jgi:cobalt-zinc-cadmium efflux system protein
VYTGWLWLDTVTSLVNSVVIVVGTWGLLRDSVRLALRAVAEGFETERIRACLADVPGVVEVHDLHIWGMGTSDNALGGHLVMPTGYPGDAVITEFAEQLNERFNIGHATVQVETDASRACALAPDHVI